MGASDVVGAGWRVWRGRWKEMFGVAFLLAGLPVVVQTLLRGCYDGSGSGLQVRFGEGAQAACRDNPASSLVGLVAALVLTPLALVALSRIALSAGWSEDIPAGRAFGHASRRLGRAILVLLLLMLAAVGLLVPPVIVAIVLLRTGAWPLSILLLAGVALYLGARLLPAVEAFVVDDARPGAAIGRAWRLTAGRGGHAVGVLLLSALVLLGLSIPAQAIPQALVPGIDGGAAVVRATIAALFAGIAGPIGVAIGVVFYLDLRARSGADTSVAAVRPLLERFDPPA